MVQAGLTAVCYDADFYPFGGERAITDTCAQTYKFEGKERDAESGNDDFGARYYSSRLGRWLSADWSSVPAPVPYANLTNPQTLNLYAMVSDNPETFADLDGHTCGTIGDSDRNGCDQEGNSKHTPTGGKDPDSHKNNDTNDGTDKSQAQIAQQKADEAQQSQTQKQSQPQPSTPTFRLPDFISVNVNVAIPNPVTATLVGVTFAVELDRKGSVYVGVGPSVGKSLTGISGSVTANRLSQTTTPTSDQLNRFLTKGSWSATGGFQIGAQVQKTSGGTAGGVGFVSPQVGGGWTYSWKILTTSLSW